MVDWSQFGVKVGKQRLDQLIKNGDDYYVEECLVDVDFISENYKHTYWVDPDERVCNPRDLVKISIEEDMKENENLGEANCFYVTDCIKKSILQGLTESNLFTHWRDSYYVYIKYGFYVFIEENSREERK